MDRQINQNSKNSADSLICWRFKRTNAEPCNETEIIEALVCSIKSNRLGFFFGAGASNGYPACLPIANELIHNLRELLNCDLSALSAEQIVKLNNKLDALGLESFLNIYVDMFSEKALSFYNIFKSKNSDITSRTEIKGFSPTPVPSYMHTLMANLGTSGNSNLFITLNFDQLFEKAFNMIGKNTQLVVPEDLPDEDEVAAYRSFLKAKTKPVCYLFKLHGTLRGDDPYNSKLLTTVERVAISLPKHKRALLQYAVSNYDICYLGYSDNDFDTFPLILGESGDRKVVWFLYKDNMSQFWDSVHPEQCKNARLVKWWYNRGAYVIVTRHPEEFFIRLHDRLGISRPVFCSSTFSPEELRECRRTDLHNNILQYRKRFFKDDLAAPLILGMVATSERTYDVASILLKQVRQVARSRKGSASFVEFHYHRHMAEVYRSVGALSRSIVSWRKALKLLNVGEDDPRRRQSRRLYMITRMGSEYMGKFKRQAAAIGGKSKIKGICRAIYYFCKGQELFLRAYYDLISGKPRLQGFDANTILSYLLFEAADFFQAVAEGLLYYWAKTSNNILRIFMWSMVRICAKVSALVYGLSLHIETQGPGMYFFQMHRRAEMLAVASNGKNMECINLMDEAASRIGKMKNQWINVCIDDEHERMKSLGDNTALTGGIIYLIKGNLELATHFFKLAYHDYAREDHKSGKVRALTYYAVLQRKAGRIECARLILQALAKVLLKYS